MNSYTWFTDLDTLKQKELCLKYNIDCHNVSLTDMDTMFKAQNPITLYYVVKPTKGREKYEHVSVYKILDNKPIRLFNFNMIDTNVEDAITDMLINNEMTSKLYIYQELK